MFSVYVLRSNKNNKIYVGSTSKEVGIRLEEHNQGSNKWTKNNGPFKLLYYETYYCKRDALHRENFLKSGVGNKIIRLISHRISMNTGISSDG